MKNAFKFFILFSFTLLINACGGSSSTTSPINTPAVTTDPTSNIENTIIVNDSSLISKQAVELILFFPTGDITKIQWTQTGGTQVNFLAGRSKVIAFTPPTAGDYSFNVTFKLNGVSKTLSKTITVNNGNSLISARLGHAAFEGNKVSLHAWLDNSLNAKSVTWQQISGPTVNLTNHKTGDAVIFFTAPNVNKDTMLKFQAQASDGSSTYSDTVTVLVKNTTAIKSNAYFDQRVAKVFPYNANSPYKDKLVACLYNNTLSSSCKLNDIPLIAQQTLTPTVNDIMNRVLVSHQWMGDRFKAFLQTYDIHNDFKNLLRATTGIVISSDIRPSFFWAATGAIYLDANNFWLTPNERDTINEAPDYRAAFGSDLQFLIPWRYVKNNNYASPYIPSDQRITRQSQDALYKLSSLLFHELAHANDFFPSSKWQTYNMNSRALDAAQTNNAKSDKLAVLYPLQSEKMRSLAQVSFAGNTATTTQKAYLPTDISGFFSPDIASDYYAFSTTREDYAMLFEETMMVTRYSVQRDIAVTNQPTGSVVYANDYIVNWGERGRIGETNIKPRANYVVQQVLPELDSNAIINALPTPIPMISGQDWVQNLTLTNSPKSSVSKENTVKSQKMVPIQRQQIRYYHKALPDH